MNVNLVSSRTLSNTARCDVLGFADAAVCTALGWPSRGNVIA